MRRNVVGFTFGAIVALSGAGNLPAAVTAQPDPAQIEFFEKKIRPVLVSSCYKCHAADSEKIKGGLLLDSREGVLKGGDTGPAIVPGNPNKSLLIQSIRHDDPDFAMPPKGDKLSDDVIADFEKWVQMGAPDPRIAKGPPKTVAMDMSKAREHWSFRPVSKPEVPKVVDPHDFVQTPIDAFILSKLQEKGLKPSSKADKRALIRRVTFDLTGLPPTAEEVEAFLAEDSPEAFAQVVDRLLASQRYGERWGRHWLDVARYADTSGDRQGGRRTNPLYPYAWTYRDYVIQAFNEDLPYDQFILQQIAADRLPEAEKDKSILPALGFLTVGKRFMGNQNEFIDDQIDAVTKGLMGLTVSCARCHDHKFDPVPTRDYYSLHGVFISSQEPSEQPLLEDPEQDPEFKEFQKEVAKVEAEVEQFRKTEAARLLAGMLEKAGDYMLLAHESATTSDGTRRGSNFRLAARDRGLDAELSQIWLETLRDSRAKNDPVLGAWFRFAQIPQKQFSEKASEVAGELAASGGGAVHPLLTKALSEKQPNSLKEVAQLYTDVLGGLREAMGLKPYVNRRMPAGRGLRFDIETTRTALTDPTMDSLRDQVFGEKSAILPDTEKIRRSLGNQFTTQENAIRARIVTLQMVHPGSPARAMAVEDSPRPRDSRIFIRGEPGNRGPVAPRQFLEVIAGENRQPFADGSGRLELARAIASRDNPLTARVMVNRVWQWHFGQAIVRTVSDFGTRSEAPTHPELLDYLASYFMENGWSLKRLHRLILLSGVYQQDSILNQAAMQKDPTNQWLWRFNLQRLDFEQLRDSLLAFGGKLDLAMGGPSVALVDAPSAGGRYGMSGMAAAKPSPSRRTVYGMIDRAALPEVFNTFDFANPDMSTGERILTTVPQQALFLMNSRFIVQQVRNLLARSEFESSGTPEEKVRFLYRTLYQRAPTAEELKMALVFLENQPGEHSGPGVVSTPPPSSENNESDSNRRNRRGMQGESGARSQEPPRQLNTWERYAQVMMLANEMVFVN